MKTTLMILMCLLTLSFTSNSETQKANIDFGQKTVMENNTPDEPAVFEINIVKNAMQFSKKSITVKAGQQVIINIENPDEMQHNMVVSKPGTMEKVGALADAMAKDPSGSSMNYIPQSSDVLFSTRLLDPDDTATLQFIAPSQPGDYPFMCTFPGHWRIMNGIIKVIK